MNIRLRFLACTLLGLLFTAHASYAQDETTLTHNAPSLQIGLDGLQFSRGTLDAELIMQIVAEKQKEVGLKVVQNMFLSKMQFAGGAFYSFTDNVIRGVVAERDIDIISRKLLENTVNITFTYAFADYYLRTFPNKQIDNFNRLAQNRGINSVFTLEQINRGLVGLKAFIPIDRTKELVVKNPNETSLIALIADISSEVIRHDTTLKQLGIMQVSYSQSYEYMNEYLKAEKKDTAVYNNAKPIYEDMRAQLKQYTNIIGLLYYHLQATSYRMNGSVLEDFAGKSSVRKVADLDSILIDVNGNMAAITKSMQELLKTTGSDTIKFRKLYTALENLQDIKSYLFKAEAFFAANTTIESAADSPEKLGINSDIVYTFYTDIIPKLQTIGIWNQDADKSIRALQDICKYIDNIYTSDTTSHLREQLAGRNVQQFLAIVSTAYQFDKANTFSNSVKLLTELEDLFPNERIKDALAFINTYIRDFVKVNKGADGKEYIDLNVESLVAKLSTVKLDKMRRTSILFNVGVNSVYFPNQVQLDGGNRIRNYSFVSEKIGVKIKLFDRYFWQTRNPGETYSIGSKTYKKIAPPKEPIISSVNVIAYGSGILYNIVNTGTSDDFNYPMLGAGFGVSFFNSLDFNVTAGIPILKNGTFSDATRQFFIGFGFDFPFTEYIKRLGERQRDNKNKKLIAEAASR